MFTALPAFSSAKMNFSAPVLHCFFLFLSRNWVLWEQITSKYFFLHIFNFGCTCLTFWGHLSPDSLLFTGQPDEHSGQAGVNKTEQLHLDAQDCQLPGDASPQPPHRGYPPFRSYQVMQESRPSKWLTSKDLPRLYPATRVANKNGAIRKKNLKRREKKYSESLNHT